jgi:tetratricopeptide (TPR) repeat protein
MADLMRGSWPPWIFSIALIVALVRVLPSWLSEVTEYASVWHEWQKVLRWMPLLDWHPVARIPAVRFLHRTRRARALVGLGRVEEGLALFDAASANGVVPRPTADAMRASLFLLARRYEDAFTSYRAALAGDPKFVWDTAIALLRYGGDVAEARALLGSRDGQTVTQLEQVARDYSRALLAIIDQRFAEALTLLDTSRGLTEQVMSTVPAIRGSYQSFIDAYRAIALAGSGDRVGAERLLGSALPFLLATREDALVAQCREAIARAGLAQAG